MKLYGLLAHAREITPAATSLDRELLQFGNFDLEATGVARFCRQGAPPFHFALGRVWNMHYTRDVAYRS
ncbi:MAG TPA: hypothetical protein VMI54_18655 [Polyangiaceae bacterium]|nr:hypothetical protein [Polyangiaceae bacterium]